VSWFPRPQKAADIRVFRAGSALNKEQLFALLHDPSAAEWQDKVGVAGPVEGSAKSTTRLMCVNGWVLKTNMDAATTDVDAALEKNRVSAAMCGRVRIWHPDKTWAAYLANDKWLPLSATPELTTLRKLTDKDEKLRSWTAMIEIAVEAGLNYKIGLDLNPSNFGRLPGSEKLYYLDDEWYPQLRFTELASAVVARIPEEPDISESEWESWGRILAVVFDPVCFGNAQSELLDGIDGHPLVPQFQAKRAAMCNGLKRTWGDRRKSSAKPNRAWADGAVQRTAIIADVHSNAVALDAVLKECAAQNVDSYIFVGDAVGYGPQPRECVQRLAELPNAQFVRGNHDHTIGIGVHKDSMNRLARASASWTHEQLSNEERHWLLALPLEARGPGWLAVHGAPKDPRRFFSYVYELTFKDNLDHLANSDIKLCFCGHTHVQYVHEKLLDGECKKLGAPPSVQLNNQSILLVNPGSVGQPRDRDNRAAFAIWDRAQSAISMHRVEYSVETVIEALRRSGLPVDLGERLRNGI